MLREAVRQAENTAVGRSPQGSRTPQEGRKRLTAEELREGLENDLGEMDGDRRGAPEQIRPSCQRQICHLLKCGIGMLDGGRRAQVRGEHRWPKLTPHQNAELARRRSLDRLTNSRPCPMCGAQCQIQTRKGKCAICETQTTPSLEMLKVPGRQTQEGDTPLRTWSASARLLRGGGERRCWRPR